MQKDLYLALIAGLLIVMPNLLWQFKNDFPVFHHLRELTDTQLVNVDRMDFFKSQALFFLGALPVICAAFIALIFYRPFAKYRPFLWSIIFTLAVFAGLRAKAYYATGLYPIYIAFGAAFLGNILQSGRKKYWQPVLILLPVVFFLLLYKVAFPNQSPAYFANNAEKFRTYGLLRWEDGTDNHLLQQDFADMLGWAELAAKVDSICAELPNLNNTFILCDNYGQAGAINYYTKNKQVTAHSFHADYINWISPEQRIDRVILVKRPGDTDRDRTKETPLFDAVYLAAQRINPLAREDTISIYVLQGAKVDVNEMIKEEVRKKK